MVEGRRTSIRTVRPFTGVRHHVFPFALAAQPPPRQDHFEDTEVLDLDDRVARLDHKLHFFVEHHPDDDPEERPSRPIALMH